MEIKRTVTQHSSRGPAEYFTGNVRIDPLFNLPEPARSMGGALGKIIRARIRSAFPQPRSPAQLAGRAVKLFLHLA